MDLRTLLKRTAKLEPPAPREGEYGPEDFKVGAVRYHSAAQYLLLAMGHQLGEQSGVHGEDREPRPLPSEAELLASARKNGLAVQEDLVGIKTARHWSGAHDKLMAKLAEMSERSRLAFEHEVQMMHSEALAEDEKRARPVRPAGAAAKPEAPGAPKLKVERGGQKPGSVSIGIVYGSGGRSNPLNMDHPGTPTPPYPGPPR